MKQFLEGSFAMAQAAKLCRPGVIAAYPITPQTHIVENLSQFIADGELDAKSVNVESEHSAASCVLGSQAAGVRSFTCSSSQGLILMSEVLFCIAGMRLPVMLVCANRALSAPINIWNDQQDSIAVRDAGWIQLYAENNQEAVDLIIASHKIAEDPKVMLPAMVCVDGFILTHGMEVVDIPEQKDVDEFLPPYNPPYKLDPKNPMSFGLLGTPDVYLETRYAIQKTLGDVLKMIPTVGKEYQDKFGRDSLRLIEEYKTDDAETILIAMGSVCGTIKDVVDSQRKQGKKVGLLKIVSYRPFPKQAIKKALDSAKNIGVIDKDISLGSDGALYSEVKSVISSDKKISGFIAGLGGRDIKAKTVEEIINLSEKEENSCRFIDLNKNILWEEFKTI
ncbi:MAG: pyruvate ferredoxin oxidoreductase [Candidatus Omnitrophica bacterium]|nr:pyruvate ferredoxin oxidoreductase [Candidatus Omnitrophota bacterium]MCF7892319.1 pyruvate ferredoxin oxidoreductase [Candidatus Omnitrophota bacterium]MCF7895746.1 pyruvate ferredoxin oxidoreductase [Candidatus Omnitrophota bacterium]MCF7897731.1 pyruvate ferredoxin oxidoreductase [Candidatus Omnitrophota bacterium]MCF7909568.1 pyruvate ferredoxin oxidoreductase [Candidatus Omnitrophota bacterium]